MISILNELKTKIQGLPIESSELDEIKKEVFEYIKNLETKHKTLSSENKLNSKIFKTFWPPRCISALINNQSAIFFGAGLSFPCGIPTWKDLLDQLGLAQEFTQDSLLSFDPLTQAELASNQLGSETLQNFLRNTMKQASDKSSVNHIALALLQCKYYITTNYDCVFEKTWEKCYDEKIYLVTNDADMNSSQYKKADENNKTILYKIHGCLDRVNEQMILTRHDYRHHYRENTKLFDKIADILLEKSTIFLGFSHQDPEISRLVDTAIHSYEQNKRELETKQNLNDNEDCQNGIKRKKISAPKLFSLQFDMREHTPEIFAARGIVALHPPAVVTGIKDFRSISLGVALVDLVAAKEWNLHKEESLDEFLDAAKTQINNDICRAKNLMLSIATKLNVNDLECDHNKELCDYAIEHVGCFASQGIYLLDQDGKIIHDSLPQGLLKEKRIPPNKKLNSRPYFQKAKLFRAPFVSDSSESIFNKHSTFFLCIPLMNSDHQMIGLLFSACQIGQWTTPIEIAKTITQKNCNFLLIDGNGICLLPPNDEFQPSVKKADNQEEDDVNRGFPYEKLMVLSKRDIVVSHIAKNIIPVAKDDDVKQLSKELTQYTVVCDVPYSHWKIGVSRSIHVPMDKIE